MFDHTKSSHIGRTLFLRPRLLRKSQTLPTLTTVRVYMCVCVVVNGSQADIVIAERSDAAVQFAPWTWLLNSAVIAWELVALAQNNILLRL